MQWLQRDSDWAVVDWYNLPDDTLPLAILPRIAPEFGFVVDRQVIAPCSIIPLPSFWDDYLRQLPRRIAMN